MDIKLTTKLAYGAGDCGLSLIIYGVQLYLLYYYTDILGISAYAAGLIFLIAIIFDAITDPIVGLYLQNNRFSNGKYRQYILIGCLPLAACNVLMYLAPDIDNQFTYALTTHLLFRTLFTFVSVPFYTLLATITKDRKQRSILAGFSMVGATVGALIVALNTLDLAEYWGHGDLREGFLYINIVYSSAALVLLLFAYLATSEDITPNQYHSVSLLSAWHTWQQNPPFYTLTLAMLVCLTSTFMFLQMLVYFLKYVANAEPHIDVALAIYLGVAALATPIWVRVAIKTSHKVVWYAGAVIYCVGLLTFMLQDITHFNLAVPWIVVVGFASSAFSLAYWSLLPNTIEYGQHITGVRVESFTYGVAALGLKVTYSFALGLSGLLLGYAGFEANVTAPIAVRETISFLLTWFPFIGTLLSVIIISAYSDSVDSSQKVNTL